MRPIPPERLTHRLTRPEARAVTTWWRGLDGPARRALCVLFDEDALSASARVVGRLVDPREPEEDFPEIDLYEHIVSHELVFFGGRTFHVCLAHEAPRAALRAGRIPTAFPCPVARRDCPMRAIATYAGGHDVRLALARRAPVDQGAGDEVAI